MEDSAFCFFAASVLLFLAPPAAGAPAGSPIKSLRGFQRLALAAGGAESATFPLGAEDFSLPDADGQFRLVEGVWTATVAGSSGDDEVGASLSFDVSAGQFGSN